MYNAYRNIETGVFGNPSKEVIERHDKCCDTFVLTVSQINWQNYIIVDDVGLYACVRACVRACACV